MKKLPVTLISGFLGSGKTTLLNNILYNKKNLKAAVIVNDMSEVNIDAQMVEHGNTLSRTEEKLVEMSNGCICCTLREDLMIEVEMLAKEGRFDYLIIESTGISEPLPVAQTFSYVDENLGIDLSKFSQLDTLVTVVDAFNFFKDFGTDDTIADRFKNEDQQDERAIVNLLIDQIEFANVIIINKIDLVDEQTLIKIRNIINRLNSDAKIFETKFSDIDLEKVVNTNLFDFDKTSNSAGWIKALEEEHISETEEYGISSMVFRSKKPFHPERFWQYICNNWRENILRSKGLFWLASRPAMALHWSQAGGSVKVDPVGTWWASIPEQERYNYPAYIENKEDILNRMDTVFGDRQNEIDIIGQKLDKEKMENDLQTCLCTDSEVNDCFENKPFIDNWPKWS